MNRVPQWLVSTRQALLYCCVIAFLLTILKLGHATQWSFGAEEQDTSRSESGLDRKPVIENEPAAVRLSEEQVSKTGVEISEAGLRAVERAVMANGIVDYDREHVAQLSVRVPGNVWRVQKHLGESVRLGETLAIVESLEVGKAKTNVLEAVVDATSKRISLERKRAAGAAIPEVNLREAEVALRMARLRLLNACQTLVNLGLPVDSKVLLDLDDEKLIQKLHFIGLDESLVATLNPTTTTSSLIPLRAPFDGVVTGRTITVGEVVSPDVAHFVVADIRHMWIMMDVPKEHAGLVKIGQETSFTPDGLKESVRGQVDWIGAELDPITRTLKVRVRVENPVQHSATASGTGQRLLKANAFGTGRIVVEKVPRAVVVPETAIQVDHGRSIVFVRDGEFFRPRNVETGVLNSGFREIRHGLKPGERVAANGSHVLKAALSERKPW